MASEKTPARPLARVEPVEVLEGTAVAAGAGLPLGEAPAEGGARQVARRPLSLRLLLRYKWTMLTVFGIVAPAALVLIWSTFRPEYRASAVIQIDSAVPRLIMATEDTTPKPGSQYEQYVLTQTAIMRSPPVLQRVIGRRDVQETDWYGDQPAFWSRLVGAPTNPLDRLDAVINAIPRRRTELVDVTATAPQPLSAAVLANAVLDEYLGFTSERFSDTDRKLFDALNEEQQKLDLEIGFAEQVITEARKDLRTGSPDELISQRRIRLDKLEADLQQIEVELAVARDQLKDYEAAAEASTQPASEEARSLAYESDPEWRRLNTILQDARRDSEQLALQFGDAHPRMEQANQKVRSAQQTLAQREAQLERLTRAGITPPTAPSSPEVASNPAVLRARLRRLEFQKELLQQHSDELRRSFEGDFKTAELLRSKTADLQRSKDKYAAVLKRKEELSEKTRVPPSIRTISRASVPTTAAEDKRLKLSAAALAAAAAAAVACAYLRLLFSPQVQEANDLDPAVRSAFLGYLPLWSADEDERLRELPLHAEAVRMTRTALLNRLRALGGNIVQITSAGPGSGKSTFAVHLARSLAQCGKHVLLVDVDLHRPTVAKFFTMDIAPGLLNLLARTSAPTAAVRSTVYPGLSVIPAGATNNAGDLELLANGAFTHLLAQWRQQYDIVVLDSPPLLVTADAAILSHHADGTVLVVRERHCHRGRLVEALAALSAAGGKLLGTVFVGTGPSARGGYGYGYGYGYGQGDEYSATLLDARKEPTGPVEPAQNN